MGKAYQPDILPADHLFKFRICEDNLIFAAVDLPDGAELIRKVNILRSFQFCFQAEKRLPTVMGTSVSLERRARSSLAKICS